MGCATPDSRAHVEERLLAAARAAGVRSTPRLFPIHVQTRMEAWTLLADARAAPRTGLSRDLATQIAVARTRRVAFAVGGPQAALTRQVVANALAWHGERPLPGLTLVFVSPEPPGAALEALARSHRVRLVHRRYP